METIKTYLDNMFANLPQTDRILRAKQDLLATMEEKYHSLKQEGKTENEAVGIVISEFGNIDELLRELGVGTHGAKEGAPVLDRAQIDAFLSVRQAAARLFATGVLLCICAPALLILLSGGWRLDGTWGLTGLFILVAVAVGLFITGGMKLKPYEHLERSVFVLDAQQKQRIEQQHDAFHSVFTRFIVIGVSLCILSPLFVIAIHNAMGVVLMLTSVACAVFLFVYAGSIKSAYDILLQREDYSVERKTNKKALSAFAAIWWPLVTIVFLVWGFLYHGWAISWIVWPIGGLLFAIFSGVYAIITGRS